MGTCWPGLRGDLAHGTSEPPAMQGAARCCGTCARRARVRPGWKAVTQAITCSGVVRHHASFRRGLFDQ